MALPWEERVVMLSINPEAATIADIAKLAAELMDANATISRLTAERDALRERLNRLCENEVSILNSECDALKDATRRLLEAVKDWHPSGESSALEMEAAVEAVEAALRRE